MSGIISFRSDTGVVTGRILRGLHSSLIPDFIVPNARDEMAVSYSGSVITVQAGSAVVGGCFVDFANAEEITVTPVTGELGHLVIKVDLGNDEATLVAKQGATLPALTLADLGDTDSGVREYPIAYYTTSGSAITALTDVRQVGMMEQVIVSDAAAATADKGHFGKYVPIGGEIEIRLTNGNTNLVPTIALNGITHSIVYAPTLAKLTGASFQRLRLKKTTATNLQMIKEPDYIVEEGMNGSWFETRYASGRKEARFRGVLAFTGTTQFGSTGLYQQLALMNPPAGFLPAGGLATDIHTTGGMVFTGTATAIGSHVYYDGTADKVGCQIARTTSSGTSYSVELFLKYIPS